MMHDDDNNDDDDDILRDIDSGSERSKSDSDIDDFDDQTIRLKRGIETPKQ
jgi:hypothetical protein